MARPVKRRRGRPFKYSASQLPPEFFKVYLPEHNSKQLVIPPDFIKNFMGKIPMEVILKNLKGEVWNVELEKAECKLLIKKGWEDFVIGNSLARGEFLIFTYKGNSMFTVKIFSINGCVKDDEPVVTNEQPHVKVKQEPNSDQIYSHETGACEKTHLERSSTNNERLSQDLHEAVTKDVPERTVESNKIRFTRVHKGKMYELHIPSSIFRKYKIERPEIKRPEMVLLKYRRGISQTVKILGGRDRVLITSGWKEFKLKNKLVKGDEYEFEISVGEGRKIKEIELLKILPRKTVTTRKRKKITLRPRNS
ncbi:hypothetical protein SOVF_008010 [Spinacia oleracea]|uniref:B3 domain-containing protein Os03g0621600 n=1 Tax=Spinacia oleracea TaxID=3562 RepID=A0A9R0HW44_SPIOL|nr:putative B3 domain-containing protein Os03g0621600 [Spinacia oleracea]KNA25273.1 hypothetical protein SOVF_008010 [Spinacia oleracea]